VATVESVERRIWNVEGFRVAIRHLDGRNVRGDRTHMPTYPYRRAMPDAASVTAWREGRFRLRYPGFEVDVLHRDGTPVHGGTLMGTVRAEYR
jgi:hypothetical protein